MLTYIYTKLPSKAKTVFSQSFLTSVNQELRDSHLISSSIKLLWGWGPHSTPLPSFWIVTQSSNIFHPSNGVFLVNPCIPSPILPVNIHPFLWLFPPSSPSLGCICHSLQTQLWFHSHNGCNGSIVLIPCHITQKKKKSFSSLGSTGTSQVNLWKLPWSLSISKLFLTKVHICSQKRKPANDRVQSGFPSRPLYCFPLLSHIFGGILFRPTVEQKIYDTENKHRHMTSFLPKGCFTKDGLEEKNPTKTWNLQAV